MRDKIIAALKTTYANLGLSDKAFGGVASILEKTVTDEEGIAAAVAAPEISLLMKAIQGETDSLRNKNVQIAKELEELKKQTPEPPKPISLKHSLGVSFLILSLFPFSSSGRFIIRFASISVSIK